MDIDLGEAPWGVAVVDGAELTTTSHRLPADGDVEIGSVSKAVTGLLFCDAVARGTVSAEDRLDRHLPLLHGCPAGAVSLGSLAQHRSGLPRLPAMPGLLGRSWRLWRHRQNPYGDTLAELLEQTRATKVGRARASYSNLGFELLGHAVAAAEDTTYAELLRSRIADPLGLGSWYVPGSVAELSPRAVAGTARGRSAEAWTGEALGPAGGIRSTLGDLATFAAALLDGSAPGSDALEPTARFAGPAVRIGAAWLTTEVRGHTVTWHNGGTGGWRSWLGVDREASRAAVVVRAATRSVDRVGTDLLSR